MSATFTGIHFWVADMAAAVRFYRAVGLDIPQGAEDEMFFHVDLPGGAVAFEFGTHDLTERYDHGFERDRGRGTNCLQFALESRDAVDAMHARLTGMGYASHAAPFDAFWGARYAEVSDPDGNVVGFQSPRDPARGGPVPPPR